MKKKYDPTEDLKLLDEDVFLQAATIRQRQKIRVEEKLDRLIELLEQILREFRGV